MSTNYRLVLQKIWEESFPNCGRISSARKALDCRAGGGGFDPQGQTNTQGLKIAEKWSYSLCTVLHCGSNDHIKWRSGDVKIVSPISTLLLNTLTLKVLFLITLYWAICPLIHFFLPLFQINFLSERLTQAKEDFEKCISLNDTFIPARIQLAYCIYKSAALQQSPILAHGAVEMLQKTVENYPDSADAHSLFAQVCEGLWNPKSAIFFYISFQHTAYGSL